MQLDYYHKELITSRSATPNLAFAAAFQARNQLAQAQQTAYFRYGPCTRDLRSADPWLRKRMGKGFRWTDYTGRTRRITFEFKPYLTLQTGIGAGFASSTGPKTDISSERQRWSPIGDSQTMRTEPYR